MVGVGVGVVVRTTHSAESLTSSSLMDDKEASERRLTAPCEALLPFPLRPPLVSLVNERMLRIEVVLFCLLSSLRRLFCCRSGKWFALSHDTQPPPT